MTKDRAAEIAGFFIDEHLPSIRNLPAEARTRSVVDTFCNRYPEVDEATTLRALEIIQEILVADEAFDNPEQN